MSLAIGATGCGAINRIHRTNGRRTRGRAARIFSRARMRTRVRVARITRGEIDSPISALAISRSRVAASGTNPYPGAAR